MCPHNIWCNMMNFNPLTAKICWRVWGTPANFNGYLVLASLLHRRRSTEVNQTLHVVWPSCGLLHCIYIYTLWGLLSLTEFCQVQHSHCVEVLRSPILAALLHDTRAVCVSQTLRRVTRKGIRELSLLVCATYIPQGGHHVGHRPTF